MSTQQLLNRLHRGGPYNFIQNLTAGPKADKRYSAYFKQGEVVKLPAGWNNDTANIYFGVHPVHTRREYFQAGRETDVAAINCLYAEFDGKDQAASEEAYYADPARYNDMALAAILALPVQPSIIVFSGGGYHCYWLLDETFIVAQDPDQHAAHINSYIKDIQERWVGFVGGDDSAKDLRRILRVPGTRNRKKKYAPNFPLVSFLKEDYATSSCLAGLVTALPPVVEPVTYAPSCNQTQAGHRAYEGDSVIAAYNNKHNIVDALSGYGYTKHSRDKMNRPDADSGGVKIFADKNTSFHRSSSDPMYTGGKHSSSPFDVLVKLGHKGDLNAAVRAAAAELGMEKKSQTPAPTFSAIVRGLRQWIVTVDLETIIPAQHHGANGYRTGETDRRAFDALIDIFERYGSFTGPISYNQGHLLSGLSADAFRNSLKRWLDTCVLSRGEPDMEGGAYHYILDTCVLSRVGVVVEAKLPPTKYASVFSQEKGEDAWQLRGSKVQKEKALIKALGPAALHVVANLTPGERTHQAALGGRTYKKASAISRIVKKLEDCGVVATEKVGRQQFVTLLQDWRERVQEYVPYMPTFGNKDRREFNADTRVVEHCDRQLAKGIGDTDKLLSKREQAMRSLAVRMERDLSGIDFDTQSEKMRRLLRMDNLQRNATIAGKARKYQAKPWMDLGKETPRMRSIRQTTEDNETLIYAREQMEQGAYHELA